MLCIGDTNLDGSIHVTDLYFCICNKSPFCSLNLWSPFYTWDCLLNMWSRVTKQEIKEEPGQWILHSMEAEEEEQIEAQEDEDVESHWEEEEDKLYNVTPRASPPQSPTPTPPLHYERINEWFNEEEDIYRAFPRPPPFPLPLIPIPALFN
jgi:hypothetical protein